MSKRTKTPLGIETGTKNEFCMGRNGESSCGYIGYHISQYWCGPKPVSPQNWAETVLWL